VGVGTNHLNRNTSIELEIEYEIVIYPQLNTSETGLLMSVANSIMIEIDGITLNPINTIDRMVMSLL